MFFLQNPERVNPNYEKPQLQALAENIWQLKQPLSFWGTQVGTCTTVVRLKNNDLWIHAPGPWIPGVYRTLRQLGSVSYLIAPNPLHHMFLSKTSLLFPEAIVYAGKKVQQKHPHLACVDLADISVFPWASEIEVLYLAGLRLDEFVFFHKNSKTLILTDLLFNLQTKDIPTRLMLYAEGVHGKLGCTRLVSKFMVQDRKALQKTCQRILAWDFERIVMCHGDIVSVQAKQAFIQAMAWTGFYEMS